MVFICLINNSLELGIKNAIIISNILITQALDVIDGEDLMAFWKLSGNGYILV